MKKTWQLLLIVDAIMMIMYYKSDFIAQEYKNAENTNVPL